MSRTNPLTDKLVTIFGGSGFIGRHVAEDLLQLGARVRIASRTPEDAFSLKPLAKLGQLQFARCNLLDEASVRACVDGSHAVVNLVGSFDGNLMKLMGEAAGTLARAARETGAQSFVQVSAIGADPDGPSEYAQAKALGALHSAVMQSSLPDELIELVFLRVSQINGCAYCIALHTRALAKAGVAHEKMALTAAWREAGDAFDARERAAFAFADSLTRIEATGALLATAVETTITPDKTKATPAANAFLPFESKII